MNIGGWFTRRGIDFKPEFMIRTNFNCLCHIGRDRQRLFFALQPAGFNPALSQQKQGNDEDRQLIVKGVGRNQRCARAKRNQAQIPDFTRRQMMKTNAANDSDVNACTAMARLMGAPRVISPPKGEITL